MTESDLLLFLVLWVTLLVSIKADEGSINHLSAIIFIASRHPSSETFISEMEFADTGTM